jgi:hypothetical protein
MPLLTARARMHARRVPCPLNLDSATGPLAERLGPGMDPGAEILNDLLAVVVRFELALDPQLAGVFPALVTLEGTLRLIDPTFNLVEKPVSTRERESSASRGRSNSRKRPSMTCSSWCRCCARFRAVSTASRAA